MIFACSVCFGQSDSPMAQATNMGIWMMLGVVAFMLASFAAFFVYLNRRSRMAASATEADSGLTQSVGDIMGARPVSDSGGA